MFQSFFQLREQPFDANPDPRFLYLSGTHREAFSSLLYRIQIDSGFLAMVAPPGMGKTMLLFHLLHRLQPTARTAFVFQTQCTSHELLQHLLSEFECDTSITDPVRMSQELKSLLLREANAGRRCVLIIDEAQNLRPDVLETIRLLSNFETPRRKLLQIVLSGQSELGGMLARPELRQLRQRLSCIIHIQKFRPEEAANYIGHRLGVAGYTGKLSDIFSVEALTRIAQLSNGIPRVINNICFNALSLAFALEFPQVSLDVVDEVANDLGLSDTSSAFSTEDASTPGATVSWNAAFNSIAAACASQEQKQEKAKDRATPGSPDITAPGTGDGSQEVHESAPVPGKVAVQDAPVPVADARSETPAPVSDKTSETPVPVADATPEPAAPISDDVLAPVASLDAQPQLELPFSLFAGMTDRSNRPEAVSAEVGPKFKGLFGKFDGQFLARICACILVLSLTPAIDAPVPRTVSAQGVVEPTVSGSHLSDESGSTLSTTDLASSAAAQPANAGGASGSASSNTGITKDRLHQLEKMWKASLRPQTISDLLVAPSQPERLIELLPLPSTSIALHTTSALPPAPDQGRTQTPTARSTSEILWPATCRQERYVSLYSLAGVSPPAQAQQTALCSFFALPASELSAR